MRAHIHTISRSLSHTLTRTHEHTQGAFMISVREIELKADFIITRTIFDLMLLCQAENPVNTNQQPQPQ